jgi:carbamoyltransferase
VKILGLHINGPQTSAALLDDGDIVFGVAEERLNREKKSNAFPVRAARWCLEAAGLSSLAETDAVAVSWNPTHSYLVGSSGAAAWRGIADRLARVPDNLAPLMPRAILEQVSSTKLDFSLGSKPDIYYVDHHLSHLAMAKFQSPFERAAAAIADEYSEKNSFLLAEVAAEGVKTHASVPFPHSLGIMYATFTEFLGFEPNSDEWKVMGAAAYGDPQRFHAKIRALMDLRLEPLRFELDLNFFEFPNTRMPGYSSRKLDDYLGIPRPTMQLEQVHYDLAAGCQSVFEDIMFDILRWLRRKAGSANLVAAGGCFMNSLANGKILERTDFERVFIPYAAADNGGAVGAALWVYHQILGHRHVPTRRLPRP